jgi:hypothetical protein
VGIIDGVGNLSPELLCKGADLDLAGIFAIMWFNDVMNTRIHVSTNDYL